MGGLGAVDVLLRQHQEVRDLLDLVERNEGRARHMAFDELRRLLAVHETAEEEVLRPLTRASLPDGRVVAQERIDEENSAKQVLALLEEMGPSAAAFERSFAQFKQMVLDHAANEEAHELPRVAAERGDAVLQAVGAALLAAETVAPTHPHPSARSTAANLLLGPFAAMADRVRDAVRQVTGG